MIPFDVDAPVTAEVFTLVLEEGGLVLTGPCGAAPWLIETDRSEHPLDTVRRIATPILDPILLHSTSWRFDRGSVILTFVVVVAARGKMAGVPVGRTVLARSGATSAPSEIRETQVLEHAIRHLAWLAAEDDGVRSVLDLAWHEILSEYLPEPFQQLG